jgi:hypothetical protein
MGSIPTPAATFGQAVWQVATIMRRDGFVVVALDPLGHPKSDCLVGW